MKGSWRKKSLVWLTLLSMFMLVSSMGTATIFAAEGVGLHTAYTHISVPPGESINYSIQISNNTDSAIAVPVSVSAPSADWETKLTAGGWDIKQVSIKPDDSQTVSLNVSVPLQIDKGNYDLTFHAGSWGDLPLIIEVSEKGTYATDLTTEQPNIEGHADSTFSYQVKLNNRTAEDQNYALSSDAPAGWNVTYVTGAKQVSSIPVEAGDSETITVSIKPPVQVEKGSYKFHVEATSPSTSSTVELEAVVIGSYGLELSTPSGLLSTDISAGGERNIELVVKNTGSADLKDINMTGTTPANWDISFNPKTIKELAAGKSTTVTATINSSDKAISGDYVTSITASGNEASDNAQFRISVKGSLLWGWLGILIIAVVIGGIYYLFRAYGRR